MFKGRNKVREGGGSAGRNSTTSRLRGLFEKGVWLCDCEPRLPAEHFRVKKEGKNQGRWFYTCQKTQERRCDFFLWDEDAKPRMEAAVLANSLSEPQKPFETPIRTPSPTLLISQPPPPYSSQTPKTPTKRKLPWLPDDGSETEDEEDNFPWPLTGQEEQALSQAVDQATPPSTPRKAAKTDDLSTPGKLRPRDTSNIEHGLATPNTTPHKLSFANAQPSNAAIMTPTPHRFTNTMATPSADDNSNDLSNEVFSLLTSLNANFNSETNDALRTLLDRHSMRIQGIIKGREISRLAVQSRNGTIARLQQRIAALGTEVESGKAVIKHLRDAEQQRRR